MIRKILLAAALVVIVIYCFREAVPSSAEFIAKTYARRRAKNAAFHNGASSPLSDAQRAVFDTLNYYPPNPDLAVRASLSREAQPDTVLIQTTGDAPEKYLHWGMARFEIESQPQQLSLFVKASRPDSTLFIPFTDGTNGRGSYGGGRYLDVAIPALDVSAIPLDFNQAYNPYCAYNDDYSCPVPPAENRLPVPIPAGEKEFDSHDHNHADHEH